MDERNFILFATLCYALSVGTLFGRLREDGIRLHRIRYTFIAAGFLLQSFFLFQRSVEIGRCPLTNLFEAFIFITWTIALLYLVISPGYRLSLLGLFSAPMIVVLNVFALVAPIDPVVAPASKAGFWIELHAPMAVMSYGAFAMAAATGAMYLVQQRLLKIHRLNQWFFLLPSVAETARITARLLAFGLAVYTVGLFAGFFAGAGRGWGVFDFKTFWSLLVWALYGILCLLMWRGRISLRWSAHATVGLFLFTILTFWGVYLLSPVHR